MKLSPIAWACVSGVASVMPLPVSIALAPEARALVSAAVSVMPMPAITTGSPDACALASAAWSMSRFGAGEVAVDVCATVTVSWLGAPPGLMINWLPVVMPVVLATRMPRSPALPASASVVPVPAAPTLAIVRDSWLARPLSLIVIVSPLRKLVVAGHLDVGRA